MKKTLAIFAAASLSLLASCDLTLYPVTGYNEGNVTVEEEESGSQYSTREDIQGLRNSIYSSWVKDIQECGLEDYLVYSESRADNAYCGNPTTAEIVQIEANNIDAENKNVTRDWNWYLGQVSNANQIICNIDAVKAADPSMTDTEYREWLSEAYCWRAWNFYRLATMWGDAPMVLTIPEPITSENIEEVYYDYYPVRTPVAELYSRMVEDLEYAAENGPATSATDKSFFTKAFAHGLLARVYAEKQIQDWGKVAEHCAAVESMGYTLCDDYGEMWSYDENDAVRNTSESIFEVQWTRSSGNWVWMMYHRNAYSPDDSYTWIKWITPSRDLIAAYDAEGDTERKNASIIFDECTWSNYYPADNYAFMHKIPTNASSVILMRLGEIYLLHAEALCCQGDLAGAAAYVDRIRDRAGLAPLSDSRKASQEALLDAILDERRLELAFEGFRFFDLVRHDKAQEVHNSLPNSRDSYWFARTPLTEETIKLPVPQTAIDDNSSLEQNPGY